MGTKTEVKLIARAELEKLLNQEPPLNDNRRRGFALVGVLPQAEFHKEHIPGSINIPQSKLLQFEQSFDPKKYLILYSASSECHAAYDMAVELLRRGFLKVSCYRGGVRDWRISELGTRRAVTKARFSDVYQTQSSLEAALEAEMMREIV